MVSNSREEHAGGTAEARSLERHTGSDSLVKFRIDDAASGDESEYYEIPVTSVDWNREWTIEDVQHNGTLEPTLTTTEIRYSGSFEWEGQNPFAMDKLLQGPDTADDATHIDSNRPVRFHLTTKEYNHERLDDGEEKVETTIVFRRCVITSADRDLTPGDVSTMSIDWEAETADWYMGEPE